MSSETCISQARTMCPGIFTHVQERTVTHRFLRLVAYFCIERNTPGLVKEQFDGVCKHQQPEFDLIYKTSVLCTIKMCVCTSHTIHSQPHAIQPIYRKKTKILFQHLVSLCRRITAHNIFLVYLFIRTNLCLGYMPL